MNFALQAIRYAARRWATPGDRRAHLVGIAGAEMQALAEVLAAAGWTLSGSDLAETPRWLWVGFWQGAVWFDDDARHPAEIRATLSALREMFPTRRVWCIFQPQRASGTYRLLDESAASLQNADRLEVIFEAVASGIRGGDILLTLGGGDIRNVWNAFTGRLRSYRAAG